MDGITRRGILGAAIMGGMAASPPGGATAWDFTFPSLEGGSLPLAQFKGRVLLVTNTASFCGYTYQYEGLEKLHRDLSPRGLTVVGVPSQDFNQESADNAKVKTFCEATFGVEFPMAAISHVKDREAAPFYGWVRQQKNWQPGWNFNKVLIGRDGAIKGTYGANTEPTSPDLLYAINSELARPTV